MEEIKDIDVSLKSEPMNEMLSHPPSWLIRSGNGLILIILLVAFGLSWLIRYPDEITGEATLTTSEPPIEMSNQLYAQIKGIAVKDGQKVTQNQLLVEFDNQAKPEHIQLASQFVTKLDSIGINENKLLPTSPNKFELGIFQESWVSLDNAITEWNSAIQSGVDREQLAAMQREITYRERLQTISSRKIKLSESEYKLIAEDLKATEQLADKSIVSRQSLNQEKRSENQAMQSVQNQKEQYVQNLIELNALRKELIHYKHEQKQVAEQRKNKLKAILATLNSKLSDWRKSAILFAPVNGKVVFNTHLQEKQFYKPGDASIVVVPNKSSYYVTAIIPSEGAGKVKRGQKAMIELTDYPKTEFGLLEGIVTHKTQIDKEGKYEVRIRLPKQLKTTYGKTIPGKVRLKGSIKIITKEKRLLARLVEKLTDLIQ